MKIETGGPAFPRPASEYTRSGTLADGNEAIEEQEGMTLRDWFAGMALNGMMSAMRSTGGQTEESMANGFSAVAYVVADAMIKARKEK